MPSRGRKAGGHLPVRRLIGLVIALFGGFVLVGGLFVPLTVILRDPAIVPAPESWLAIWIIAVGLAIAIWPARRDRG